MDEEEALIAELSQDEDPLTAVDPALRTDDPTATAHRTAATKALSVLQSSATATVHRMLGFLRVEGLVDMVDNWFFLTSRAPELSSAVPLDLPHHALRQRGARREALARQAIQPRRRQVPESCTAALHSGGTCSSHTCGGTGLPSTAASGPVASSSWLHRCGTRTDLPGAISVIGPA
ncbi:hypothetical protein [Lentzea jiangxiensis]|uniref:hypothetical protein n=1 Tax=Lentzea jiangxiensis TaxID=641025 RepID=UPI000B7FD75B|nr:hypothetical protein [Lentzea jiangxiensis]